MKTLNNLNLLALSFVLLLCILGFFEETFIYIAIYAGALLAALQAIGILIRIAKYGPNAYTIAYLLLALLAILQHGFYMFILTPIAILYVTTLLYFKNRNYEP